MRRLALLVTLALLPVAAAAESYVVLLDWQEGHSLVGTTRLLVSPLAPAFALEVGACHRALWADLLYSPANASVDAPGVGGVTIQHDLLLELSRDGEVVAEQLVREPAYGIPLGTVEAGAHTLRVSLANGADVEWELRVRGKEVVGELACEPRVVVNEVEADPAGADAGAEWIELHHAGDEPLDLHLWRLAWSLGERDLPAITLEPGARLLVALDAHETLADASEIVRLVDAFGRVRDETPPLTDGADDARTWQRTPDGADTWTFAPGTP